MERTDESRWHEDPDELLGIVRRVHAEGAGGPTPEIEGHAHLREIARGGQSVVYRATETESGEEVAVKVLAPGALGSETSELRFEREFHALRTLRHPGLVGGRTCGRTADGRRWLTMEFVDGPRLDEWAAARRADDRPPDAFREEALAMFSAIARAVRYAHQHGVLHRDLKPSNIRIDPLGAPRVLDFGIAKVDLPADDDTRLLTVSRQFLGTPGYAAPEQVAGRLDEIDARTDVHALGLLLYELLVGRPPYPVDAGLAATLTAIESAPPPRPSRADPGIDADLDAIVLCALQKDPADRYQSVDALLADLDRRRDGLPVQAHPAGAFYELRKWVGRNRLLFGLAAALVALLASFGVTAGVLLSRERATRAGKERLSDYLLGLLLSTDPFRSSDPARSVDALLAGAADRLKVELADDPIEQARLLNVVGIHHRTAARYPESEEALREALRLRRAEHDGDHEDVAESLTELGSLFLFVDRLAEAEPMLREALAMRRRLHGESDLRVAENLGRLGHLLVSRDERTESRALLEEALRIRLERLGEDDAATVASMHQLSQLHQRAGDLDEARALQERALRIRKERGMPAPSVAAGHGMLGRIAQARGDLETAERELRRARDLRAEALGPEHEDVAVAAGEHAFVLAARGETAAALAEAEEALRIVRRTLPATHPHVMTLRVDVAAYRARLGALDVAEEELRSAHAETVGGSGRLASALELLAVARLERGELEAAGELLRLALGQVRRLRDAPPERAAGILGSLGWIAGERGDPETARANLAEAVALLDGHEDDPAHADFLARLATHLRALGREEEARRAAASARASFEAAARERESARWSDADLRTRARTERLLRELEAAPGD